jgi:hypothetical protein
VLASNRNLHAFIIHLKVMPIKIYLISKYKNLLSTNGNKQD